MISLPLACQPKLDDRVLQFSIIIKDKQGKSKRKVVMMNKVIYAYRLVDDTGFAPCVDNGLLSLACCKGGQVRNGRNIRTGLRYHVGKHRQEFPEDEIYLLGIYHNRLLYYAKVTSVMDMTEYFSEKTKKEFGKRKDHIYDVRDGALQRNDFVPYIHEKGDIRNIQDANGVFVLLSRQFTYFGRSAPDIPQNLLAVLPRNRETKKYIGASAQGMNIHERIMDIVGSFRGAVDVPHEEIDFV